MREQLLQRATRSALAQHDEDRVVTGHRAGDPRQAGLVDPPRDQVCGSWRCLDHGQVFDELDREHELTHQRSGVAITAAGPDQPELLDVSRDRRLRCSHPAARERCGDVLLRVRGAAIDHVEDCVVALALGWCHLASAWCIVACALSISALPMISGGTRRMELSSTALTISPASRHSCWTAFARGSANSKAGINPRPRTSLAPISSSASWRTPPISAAWPTSPSRSITESTAMPAAQASGLPPNVEPWSPGSNTSARGAARQAPIGTPPPSPLASVITSGVMPWCWWANQRPVRPSPVCTSSRISRMSCALHHSRTPSR